MAAGLLACGLLFRLEPYSAILPSQGLFALLAEVSDDACRWGEARRHPPLQPPANQSEHQPNNTVSIVSHSQAQALLILVVVPMPTPHIEESSEKKAFFTR